SQDSFDQVTDVTETSGLLTIAADGEILPQERLFHKVGDYAAIVQLQSGTVSIENSHDPGVQVMITVVGHGSSFGKAFSFVIDGPRTDGIDPSPVGFFLRILLRISVTLTC